MSHSFIDRSSNYFTQNYDNEEPQKKIDPIAQLKELNNTTVREWGLFNNPSVQMFAKEEELSAKEKAKEEEEKVQAKNEKDKIKITHTVKKGDTYYSLSKKYGVTVEQLREWNGYDDYKIPIGTELIVSPNLSTSRIISSSIRRPLLDPMDPTKLRDDLVFGDKTNENIIQEGEDYLINLYKVDASKSDHQLFENFYQMASELFTSRDMTPVLKEMINFFESNSGGEMGKELSSDGNGYAVFINDKLNEEVKNSEEVQGFLQNVKEEIKIAINSQTHPDKITLNNIGNAQRPRFNNFWTHTFRGGLTIALNDTQAFDITLNELIVNDDDTYLGFFTVTIYDHFGLDEDDITTELFPLAGFRAWYRLQRERGYRPFVTKVTISESFSGKLGE